MHCTKEYGFTPAQLDWSCPADIQPYIKAFHFAERLEDEHAWLQGRYTYEAVLTAIENAFAGKKSKMKYTEKPYTELAREDKGQIAYEEKMRKVKGLFMQLNVMKLNYDVNHPKEGD